MTALRAKAPEAGRRRLKLFLCGEPKVGKTYGLCQFPKAYYIDTEQGAVLETYVELLQQGESVHLATNVFEEVVDEVKALMSVEHDYRTLVIDSVSPIYADLVEQGEAVAGTAWNAHYRWADSKMKRLFLLLDRLDMNVVITSHAKDEYKRNPHTGELEATGHLASDAWKKLPYQFDLLLDLRRVGDERMAEVRGTRIKSFQDGEDFAWSYQAFESRLGNILTDQAQPERIVSAETVRLCESLIARLEVSPETIQTALTRARAQRIEDLPEEHGKKLLAWLQSKHEMAESTVARP